MITTQKTKLKKTISVLLLAMMLSVFSSLSSSAASKDQYFSFRTIDSANQALISIAGKKDNASSIYCQIQHTNNSAVTYAYVNARGGTNQTPTSG